MCGVSKGSVAGRLAVFALALFVWSGTVFAATPPKIKLTFAIWRNDATHIERTKQMLDEYEKMNPGVEVELIYQAYGGYHEKMTALAATGLTPDVLAISRVYLASYAEAGTIRPIEDFLKQDKIDLAKDVVEVNSGSYKGHIYGIPVAGGPGIFMYNVDMIDSLGLESPAKIARANQWTWDRFYAMGAKITRDIDGNGTIDTFARALNTSLEADWEPAVWSYGGEVISADGTKALLDQPKSIEGLKKWIDMARVMHIAPQSGEKNSSWASGGRAFEFSWASGTMSAAAAVKGAFKMALVPMPAGPAGMFHVAGGVPLCVSSTTAHPWEAYKFSVWYALQSDEWKLIGIPASLPTLRKDYLDYIRTQFDYPEAIAQAVSNPTRVEASSGIYRDKLLSTWSAGIKKAYEGKASVEEAVAEMTRLSNVILSGK